MDGTYLSSELEVWRGIEGFPLYEVSSRGRVKNVRYREPRKLTINKYGFPVVLLLDDVSSRRYLRQVNRLVAEAFLPPPKYAEQTAVWHKDGDLLNCDVDNLMWDMRARVLEWNDMHRRDRGQWPSPMVKNNRTGAVYNSAYECAIAEGVLESQIFWSIETAPNGVYDDNARYRWLPYEEGVRAAHAERDVYR